MSGEEALLSGLIRACHAAIEADCDRLCALDRPIGDGDHGTNMRRGMQAVLADLDRVSMMALPDALAEIGLTLVMSVGGAAGPLYGTLLIETGRRLAGEQNADFRTALAQGVAAVAARGRSGEGDKTMLDVLFPVLDEIGQASDPAGIAARAERAAADTAPLLARRGRAAFLGDRSIGHVDPGAASCAVLTGAICRHLMERASHD